MADRGTTTRNADGPVDWDAARTLTSGDDELLGELVELFPEEGAKHLATLRTAIAEGDAASLTRAAHTLKTSAKFFGAEELAARALEMETLGRAANISDAGARLTGLEAATQRVIEALALGPPPAPTKEGT